jgi:hypothetical protein
LLGEIDVVGSRAETWPEGHGISKRFPVIQDAFPDVLTQEIDPEFPLPRTNLVARSSLPIKLKALLSNRSVSMESTREKLDSTDGQKGFDQLKPMK